MEYLGTIRLAEIHAKVALAYARNVQEKDKAYANRYITYVMKPLNEVLPDKLQADAGDSDLFERNPKDELKFRIKKKPLPCL